MKIVFHKSIRYDRRWKYKSKRCGKEVNTDAILVSLSHLIVFIIFLLLPLFVLICC